MAHSHDHTHSHDHDHGGDTYFIDQLCMVGLSGAFGMICLCLWFLQYNMLNLMLGAQFHYYVLASGFMLVALAGIRGAILWQQSRDPHFKGGHDHDHGHHSHDHSHEHHHAEHDHGKADHSPTHAVLQTELKLVQHSADCGHAHAPGESCGHDHGHQHHHHHHDHDEADHDHKWAPWRYVVILVPIILFFLGLPNKPPSLVAGGDNVVAISPESERFVLLKLLGDDVMSQLVLAAAQDYAVHLEAKKAQNVEKVVYKTLEGMATSAESRAHWKDKYIEVRGQYSPMQGSSQVFQLVRLKISCCANDAVQLNVPMICNENIQGVAMSDWIKVTGRVDFREKNGAFRTVVIIPKAKDVEKCPPDTNPYIQ